MTFVVVGPVALAQEQHVWSGTADFLSGTAIDTSVTASGALVLSTGGANGTAGSWAKYVGNPVLTPSQSWDTGWVLDPHILFENGTYKMWYEGCAGQVCDVGYATSADGTSWTPYAGNPVLLADASSWDTSLGSPHVIHDGSVYRMWYAGNGPLAIRIGYATSADGIHWTKYGTWPIFNGTLPWDSAAVTGPAVVKSGSTFIMYFSGHPGTYDYSMGRATSTDGIHWTEYAGNPVMTYTQTWEQTRVHPSYFSIGPSGYDLYYSAGAPGGIGGVGHATSSDGVTWIKDASNPVLSIGPPGGWDGSAVGAPFLANVSGQLRMYYTGYNTTSTPSVLQIGYATVSPGGSSGTSYAATGTWISAPFDSASGNTTWASLSWSATIPPNTGFAAALGVGQTPVPDSSWTLSTPSTTSPVSLQLPKARYAVVIVALVSSDGTHTPALASVTVTYETPAPPASGTSPPFGTIETAALVLLITLAGAGLAALVAFLVARRSSPATRPGDAGGAACPACGATTRAGARFCDRCGAPLGPPGA